MAQVLLDQGLLLGDVAEEHSPINPDDEILAEIKRTFVTLRKLHKYNVDKLEKLSESAKVNHIRTISVTLLVRST